MKKSLIALAVLSSLSAAAFAQTNVTIYGVADAGIAYDKNISAADKSTWKLQSGQQSTSRLGFKGTEDLGGGLSAIFTLENGFNIDDGSLGNNNRLFGRQAWVGLNGDFGNVKLGRQQTALYNSLLAVDPFSVNLAGNAQKIFGYGLYAADPLSRTDNTITYATPNISGVTGLLSYGFGEQPGSISTGRNAAFGLKYENGPLNVQFVYQDARDATLAASAAALGVGVTADLRSTFIGGTYDLGVAKAHLAFADSKADSGAVQTKNRNWLLGVSAPIGADTLMASYARNDVRDIANGVTSQYAIGYSHPLSKRTNLYTSLGYTKNDSNVRLNAAANGENGTLFNAGVRHTF
ncbi:porin [Herbaspirillum sp. ST 5-3]|uniref:porin n=1 Tax=Oxalobacteraceae TaxID=75682 RepID=UPI0010A3FBF6|nr:porin [Herbaspirillum sp. ST 5-3]